MSTEEDKKLELAEAAPTEQPREEPQLDAPEDLQPKPKAEADAGPGDKQTVEEPTEPEIQQLPKDLEEATAESTGKRSPTPEAAKPKSSGKGSLEAHVDLLDGEVLQLQDLERKVKGTHVIDQAHIKQDTEERDFFSVFYYDEYSVSKDNQEIHLQQKIFLDQLKPLKPQLHPPEKQELPIMLTYGVKYYVPDPAKLREDYSRYLYCVQLCDDIRRNRVRVDRETAIRLTALMLQGTLDDYDPELHKDGYTKKFPNFELLPVSLQPDNYEDQVIEVHKAKTGYTPAQAESEFLALAKDLPRYGQHLFLATDADGNPVMIGNSCKGVSIYHDYNNDAESQLILWRDIVKISYKKHKFRVKYHPPENANDEGKRPVHYIKFRTAEPPQAKRIWKNAVEQHAFFRLTAPDPPSFIERLARRTSFRFSGNTLRQSMRLPPKRDHFDFNRRTLSMRAKPRRNFEIAQSQSVPEATWVILDRPPAGDAIDLEKFERQKVVVDFRLAESADDQAQRYVLRKGEHGSYQMLDIIDFADEKEKDFHLSEVDEESKAAMVSVILNVEAPSNAAVSHAHHDYHDQPVFDSKRMPVVRLGGATRVETASVVESEGRPVTSGRHSQQYPLEVVADADRSVSKSTYDWLAPREPTGEEIEPVKPAVDGSVEAQQVDKFLDMEAHVMKQVMDDQVEATPTGDETTPIEIVESPPAVEVEVVNED